MSHVATIDLHITDLDALKRAAQVIGLEFKENQKTYHWYGRSVGDYPLPEGFKASDLGHCAHAISVPGKKDAYEVGVVPRRDGKPGYTLMWDFWNGGYGLKDKVGENAGLLKQAYAAEIAAKELRRKGYRVQSSMDTDGRIVLRGRS